MTKLRSVLASATILAAVAPFAAQAQPITGLYIGGAAGYNMMSDESGSVDKLPGRSSPPLQPSAAVKIGFGGGFGLMGAIGYGVGNGVRLEIEASYRSNSQSTPYVPPSSNNNNSSGPTTVNSGTETKYGAMVNAYYDISVGKRWIFPYVGVGFGYQQVRWADIGVAAANIDYLSPTTTSPSGSIGALAYQGIIGASFPISYVPGLSITAEYRYMGLAGNRSYAGTGYTQYITTQSQYKSNATKVHVSADDNSTFLLGFRYAFNPDGVGDTISPVEAASYRTPAAVPAPASAARMYLIFFDFDSAALTPRARDIVAEAVRNSARIQHTRIEVSGNADSAGDPAYNQRLSQARAEAVATEMTRWGVPRTVMDIHAYGDSRPLVPTAAGVREPQNRRVEIVYR